MKAIQPVHAHAPGDIPNLFAEAWNRRDAAGIAGLFAEDAEFVNVTGLWWHDREAIWKAHDYGLRVIFKDSRLEVREKKVRQLSEDVALVHARMRLSGQSGHSEAGRPGVRFTVFSFVARRQEEGWLCVSAHNTDQVPGKETNVVDERGEVRAVDYRGE
ncbi:MAG: SgcJ/EcaC family oxidoreductase [Phaeodactylibacter sp.]|nr:SgcJ/EcaC family oxidoreductase [Phaeodactylibacter sp.]